jgi:hypothetical protein
MVGTKPVTEATDATFPSGRVDMVGERRQCGEGKRERDLER